MVYLKINGSDYFFRILFLGFLWGLKFECSIPKNDLVLTEMNSQESDWHVVISDSFWNISKIVARSKMQLDWIEP